MKVLVKKKCNFVELLWAMFITQNKVDLRYIRIEVSNTHAREVQNLIMFCSEVDDHSEGRRWC